MLRYLAAAQRQLRSLLVPATIPLRPRRRARNRTVIALREFLYRHVGVRIRQHNVRHHQQHDPGLDAYLADHVCLRPFQYLDVTNRGLAHVCCADWLPTPIGTVGDDLLRQWSDSSARKIRQSVIDGSYGYCSRLYCPAITNRTLPHRDSDEVRATLAAFAAGEDTAPPPKLIGLSYDRSCNLSCPSCRTAPIVADRRERKKLDAIFERAVLPLLRVVPRVYITGTGDPFGSAHFRKVIKRLNRQEFPHLTIDLHTNAQLFDERAWNELGLAGRVGNVEISIDAAEADTYAIVRRGGDFHRLRKNLAFIRKLRAAGQIRNLDFSMVVQRLNFREMPAFVRLAQEFGADHVSFQMIRNWGTFTAAEFAQEFIGDSAHPEHRAFVDLLGSPELAAPNVMIGNLLGYAEKAGEDTSIR